MLMMEQNQEMFAKNANHLIAPIEAKDVKERYVGSDDEFDFFVTDEEVSYGIKDELAGDFSPNALVRELIFVVGIYAPGEIETIINNANSKALIIIIEPRLSFLLHAMERKDLSFLANPNVILIAQKLEALPQIIDQLFTSPALFLTGNLRF